MTFFDHFKKKKTEEERAQTETDILEQAENTEVEKAAVPDKEREGKESVAQSAVREEVEARPSEEMKAAAASEESSKKGILERFKIGLSKTRDNITGRIDTLIKSTRKLDDEFFEELEDILIQADVGMNTTITLVDKIRERVKKEKINDPKELIRILKDEISSILDGTDQSLNLAADLTVIMVVGVNGAGKTTSIAKLAHRYKQEGKRVILAAGDTFRAAAIDQLQIWADRIGVELIKHQEGADPGAVVFDAMKAAQARRADILIVDTAGRLQNKANLMKEITKVRRVIERELPAAPHEVLLVVDATTGQNAISQARIFGEATGVSGIVLTKLDGTAKGGIVIAVAQELEIPVKLVGIGEGIEDLRDFSAEAFVEALFAQID